MIIESYVWKDRLYEHVVNISKLRDVSSGDDRKSLLIQESLAMGAYIVRKLNESQKLPPEFLKTKFEIGYANKRIPHVDDLNRNDLDKSYELRQLKTCFKNYRFIINQLIHSYSFGFVHRENKIESLLINSWTERERIFIIDIKQILEIYLSVSEGDLVGTSFVREILNKSEDGEAICGGMKFASGKYEYPVDFNIHSLVGLMMDNKANLYDRNARDWSNCNYTGTLPFL